MKRKTNIAHLWKPPASPLRITSCPFEFYLECVILCSHTFLDLFRFEEIAQSVSITAPSQTPNNKDGPG